MKVLKQSTFEVFVAVIIKIVSLRVSEELHNLQSSSNIIILNKLKEDEMGNTYSTHGVEEE
jgi:hypothetical protein